MAVADTKTAIPEATRARALRSVVGRGRKVFGEPWLLLLSVWILLAVAVPFVWHDLAYQQSLRDSLLSMGAVDSKGVFHIAGTDSLGRDVFVRILAGARISLLVSLSAVTLAGAAGLILGTVAGFLGGWTEVAIGRLMDAQQALPAIAIALFIAATLGASTVNLIIVLGVVGWVNYARVAHAEALSLKQQGFVEAARANGASQARILLRHLIPNLLPSTITIGVTEIGRMVILESSLSFLGFGVQPPTPSIGTMIKEAQSYIYSVPSLSILPGVWLFLFVAAIYRISDSHMFRRLVRQP